MSLVEENIVNFDPVLREHRAAMAALRENLDRLKKTLAADENFSSAADHLNNCPESDEKVA